MREVKKCSWHKGGLCDRQARHRIHCRDVYSGKDYLLFGCEKHFEDFKKTNKRYGMTFLASGCPSINLKGA